MNVITIIGKWPYQFSNLMPLLLVLEKRGFKLIYCVSNEVTETFQWYFKTRLDCVERLEGYIAATKNIERLHRWLIKIFSLLPKKLASNRFVNAFLKAVIGLIFRNPFNSDVVLHLTKSQVPWLLCARNLKVVTVIGSWDHFAKYSAGGYISNLVVSWNQNLASDWIQHQENCKSIQMFPAQFRYLRDHEYTDCRISQGNGSKKIMYALSSSANSFHLGLFEEELKVIQRIANVAAVFNVSLLIKPKPEGKINELDELSGLANIDICDYLGNGEKDKMILTSSYNQRRIEDLLSVDLVISIGTTFTIDAALASRPTLMLKVGAKERFHAIYNFQNKNSHEHIRKYLLCEEAGIIEIRSEKCLDHEFATLFTNYQSFLKVGSVNSERLKSWLNFRPGSNDYEIELVSDAIAKLASSK